MLGNDDRNPVLMQADGEPGTSRWRLWSAVVDFDQSVAGSNAVTNSAVEKDDFS